MKVPGDIKIAACVTVSRAEYNREPDRINRRVSDDVRMQIAHFIQQEKVETIEHDYRIEKRLELYVASPKEFWEIVQREAEKIAMRYM